jgi:3-hydroxybutyryl-CoA dehydrogenase
MFTSPDVNAPQLEKAIQTISKNFDRQIAKQTATEESQSKGLFQISKHSTTLRME